MAKTKKEKTNEKKEYGKISLSLVLTKEQIDACSCACVKCESLDDTIKKVSSVLVENEEAILEKGYDPNALSHAIAASLYPAIEQLRKEGKLEAVKK